MISVHRGFVSLLTATAGLFLFAASAQAAAAYTFSSGAAALDTVNHTATVPIYLHEASGASSQINSDGGLFSFGLSLVITSGTGTIENLVKNSAFDATDGSSTSGTSASLWAEQNINFPNGPLVDANGNVFLATLTLQGITADTSFSVSDYGSGSQTVDYGSHALDPTTTFNATVAVPEPGSLFMMCGTALILLAARRRPRMLTEIGDGRTFG